jgi:hypothetical protein
MERQKDYFFSRHFLPKCSALYKSIFGQPFKDGTYSALYKEAVRTAL